MNEIQSIWLEAYRGYLMAASPFNEHSPSDYTEAKEFADGVISSINALKEPPCE